MPRPGQPSRKQSWNSQPEHPPFRHHPPFFAPPCRHPGPSPWGSAPPPGPFGGPPSRFGGPPPFPPANFSCPPPPPPHFPGPPPNFSGPPPPLFGNGNQPPPNAANPSSGSGTGQPGGKRPLNNVWSDPCLFMPNQRTFDRPPNQGPGGRGGGHPGQNRGGWHGGGRGRGRNNNQFQQGYNNNSHHENKNFGEGIVQQSVGVHPPGPVNNVKNNNNQFNNIPQGNINNNNNNQTGGKKKKKKVDKRDLPEYNQYHCEVCDRGFRTEEKYQEHCSEHTKCNVEGCGYVAVPKLVHLHYMAQHRTGLAKNIWSLNTPEAIKKWKEDRKRNYPTKENIARKEKLRAERIARGELIETKRFGKMRGRGRDRWGHRGRRGGGRGGRRWEPWNDFEQNDGDEIPLRAELNTHAEGGQGTHDSWPGVEGAQKRGDNSPQENDESLPAAKKRKLNSNENDFSQEKRGGSSNDPLSMGINREGTSDSDSSGHDPTPGAKTLGSGLASLMASYDNSATREDEELTDEANAATTSEPQASNIDPTQKAEEKITEDTEEVSSSFVRRKEEEPAWVKHNRRQWQQKHKNNIFLEKILADEIRHERNVLLQCVHYIVNNNFLGVVDQKKDTVGK